MSEANRRLLPASPSPREGLGWGNVGNLVPSHAKSRPTGLLLCGVVNKFLTNYEDLMAVYSFGLQIDVTMQP